MVAFPKLSPRAKAIIREYVESIVIAVVLALLIREFVVQAFKIPTGSMRPTLMESDRILVNKFIYRFRGPQRGDIIVFRYPFPPKKDFIKRVMAFGGETLEIKDGAIYINGKKVTGPKTITEHYYENRGQYGAAGQKVIVPRDNFFVLGDNSSNSTDSRYWGFVPKKKLIGKAMVAYWPLNRIRVLK